MVKKDHFKISYINGNFIKQIKLHDYMEASEPKLVNPVLNIIGVNSLRLGGLHMLLDYKVSYFNICFQND